MIGKNKWEIGAIIFLVVAIISASFAGYYAHKVNELAAKEWDQYLDRTVNHIFEDSSGDIWFEGGDYLAKFDGKNWEKHDLRIFITSSAQDRFGNIWVGTLMDGLYKFDGIKWTVYDTSNSKLLCDCIDLAFSDSSGNIWVETKERGTPGWVSPDYFIYKIDGENWTIYDKNTTRAAWSNWTYIGQIFEDSSGNLWFLGGSTGGGIEGVIKFDGVHWAVYNESNSGILSNNILCIYEDYDGNLWFGSSYEDGVSVFDGDRWATCKASDPVHSIAQDGKGNMWLGTESNDPIWRISSNDFYDFKFTGRMIGVGRFYYQYVFSDREGRIWMLYPGREDYGVLMVGPYEVEQNHVAWKWEIEKKYDIGYPETFFQDSNGNIWIGTLADGVLKLRT